MSSAKKSKKGASKKRAQRATSNVFAMFDQSQIQEFKEAFNMIDQNRDGFIDKEDLHDMLASLGKDPPDSYLDNMMKEAPGPINFTMFLTLFGEKLNGTDPEDVIKNAFACFDAEQTGFIKEDYLRELLMTMGDRYTSFLCLKHLVWSTYAEHIVCLRNSSYSLSASINMCFTDNRFSIHIHFNYTKHSTRNTKKELQIKFNGKLICLVTFIFLE